MEIVLVIAVLFSFVVVGWLAIAQAGEPPAPGKPAPTFRLHAMDGTEHLPQSLRGRRAVLVFHPQDETPECLALVEQLLSAAGRIEAAGASLTVVVVSTAEVAKAYAAKHGEGLRVLCDTRGSVTKEFGTLVNLGFLKFAKKLIVLVDARGNVERIWRDAVGPPQVESLFKALETPPGATEQSKTG